MAVCLKKLQDRYGDVAKVKTAAGVQSSQSKWHCVHSPGFSLMAF